MRGGGGDGEGRREREGRESDLTSGRGGAVTARLSTCSGVRLRVEGSGFRVRDFRFQVSVLGFRV